MESFVMTRKLPEAVAEKLRTIIIEEEMAQGDKLPTESELTTRFSVSRSTIREAVKILQAERIVEIRRGQGTFVADSPGLSKDPLGLRFTDQKGLLKNLMEARKLIEPGAAYLAALRRRDEELRQMRTLIAQMDEAYQNRQDYTPFDMRFHTVIAQCTQNSVLERLLPVINESITEGYHQTVHVQGSYPRASQCHMGLFAAIAASEAEEARRIAELHIAQTLEDSHIE